MAERSPFDDKTVGLVGQPEAFADLADVLSSRTRVRVLVVLVRADAALHIQEVARRVGVDASPVRTHLEVLVRAGLAREVRDEAHGRERRFTSDLREARLVLEGIHRRRLPPRAGPAPKAVARLEKKLDGLGRKRERLDREAAKVRDELAKASAPSASG